MAKQHSIFKVNGTLDDVTFYKGGQVISFAVRGVYLQSASPKIRVSSAPGRMGPNSGAPETGSK